MIWFWIGVYVVCCFISFGFVNAYFQSRYYTDSKWERLPVAIVLSIGGPISLLADIPMTEVFKYGWLLGRKSKKMKIQEVESKLDSRINDVHVKMNLFYFGDR